MTLTLAKLKNMAEDVLWRLRGCFGEHFHAYKDKQAEAIISAWSNDVLCVLPTGYGKTVIFQSLPFLTKEQKPTCIVIVNALSAILDEQQHRFGSHAIRVDGEFLNKLQRKEENKDISRLKSGDESVLYIIGHPENLVDKGLKELLILSGFAARVSHLVIDEAHCVLSWGTSDFRPAYLRLGQLRAVFSGARVMALTATATPSSQKDITKWLCMNDPVIIAEPPDRHNVYLEVKKRPASSTLESYIQVLNPFLEDLRDEGVNFPKTIIYVPLKWCGQLHDYAITNFLANHPDHCPPSNSPDEDKFSGLVAQYHAPQSQQMKSAIADAMKDEKSHLRMIFATEAYGMGIDVPDIRHVIHIGPPNSLETFVQETGRCGRDGQPSKSTLFFNKTDIASNKDHMNDSVRKYCQINSCRREFIIEYFGFEYKISVTQQDQSFKCCDICDKAHVPVHAYLQEMTLRDQEMPSCHQKKKLKKMLLGYFEMENKIYRGPGPSQLHSKLSPNLADVISQSFNYASEDVLKTSFPFLQSSQVGNISKIVQSVRKC